MTKQEFMHRLAEQLVSLPPEERLCALKFYDEYFADAGEENWPQLIRDLGSPEEVARTIREDFAQRNPGYRPDVPAGQYTYRPGPQYRPGQGPQTYTTSPETYVQRGYGPVPPYYPPKRSGCGTAALVLLLIISFPVWFVALLVLLAVIAGLLAGAVGILAAVVAVIGILIVGGLAWAYCAVLELIATPGLALMGAGIGLAMTGVGLLGFALCAWIAVNLLPPVFRWFVDLCRKPFHKNDGGVQQ